MPANRNNRIYDNEVMNLNIYDECSNPFCPLCKFCFIPHIDDPCVRARYEWNQPGSRRNDRSTNSERWLNEVPEQRRSPVPSLLTSRGSSRSCDLSPLVNGNVSSQLSELDPLLSLVQNGTSTPRNCRSSLPDYWNTRQIPIQDQIAMEMFRSPPALGNLQDHPLLIPSVSPYDPYALIYSRAPFANSDVLSSNFNPLAEPFIPRGENNIFNLNFSTVPVANGSLYPDFEFLPNTVIPAMRPPSNIATLNPFSLPRSESMILYPPIPIIYTVSNQESATRVTTSITDVHPNSSFDQTPRSIWAPLTPTELNPPMNSMNNFILPRDQDLMPFEQAFSPPSFRNLFLNDDQGTEWQRLSSNYEQFQVNGTLANGNIPSTNPVTSSLSNRRAGGLSQPRLGSNVTIQEIPAHVVSTQQTTSTQKNITQNGQLVVSTGNRRPSAKRRLPMQPNRNPRMSPNYQPRILPRPQHKALPNNQAETMPNNQAQLQKSPKRQLQIRINRQPDATSTPSSSKPAPRPGTLKKMNSARKIFYKF